MSATGLWCAPCNRDSEMARLSGGSPQSAQRLTWSGLPSYADSGAFASLANRTSTHGATPARRRCRSSRAPLRMKKKALLFEEHSESVLLSARNVDGTGLSSLSRRSSSRNRKWPTANDMDDTSVGRPGALRCGTIYVGGLSRSATRTQHRYRLRMWEARRASNVRYVLSAVWCIPFFYALQLTLAVKGLAMHGSTAMRDGKSTWRTSPDALIDWPPIAPLLRQGATDEIETSIIR